jgi:thiol-disulfide isomerase/thioredoxin
MPMDAVLAFLLDHFVAVFGGAILVLLAVMWIAGKPSRWWKWLVHAGAVGFIAVSVAALWFFAGVERVLDHRLTTLEFTEYGSTTPRRLADYRGKVVLVNYWATWCPPCRAEMPDINRAVDAYRGRNVVFLALTDEDAETIRKFTEKNPIRATVARFTSDKPSGGLAAFVYQGRPTTMILDANGKVSRRLIGMQTFERFDEAIRAAM